MGICTDLEVSLRVFGDDLEPARISTMLGKEATMCRRRGDLIPTREGNGSRTAKSGSWIYSVKTDRAHTFDELVGLIFMDMTDNLAVWADISRQYNVDLFVGVFLNAQNQGIALSRNILEFLASRAVSIDFDIYCSDTENAQ